MINKWLFLFSSLLVWTKTQHFIAFTFPTDHYDLVRWKYCIRKKCVLLDGFIKLFRNSKHGQAVRCAIKKKEALMFSYTTYTLKTCLQARLHNVIPLCRFENCITEPNKNIKCRCRNFKFVTAKTTCCVSYNKTFKEIWGLAMNSILGTDEIEMQ